MESFNSPIIGNGMFSVVPMIFTGVFLLIIGIIIFTIVKGIGTWSHNNAQPRLTVAAKIVSKRQRVSHSHSDDNFSTTDTTYYVTFEVESGDRMEFEVRGSEYGLLAEQDKGKLTFQGTRYLGFERIL